MTTFDEAAKVMARAGRELERLRGIIAEMLADCELAECALIDNDTDLAAEKVRAIKASARGYENAPE